MWRTSISFVVPVLLVVELLAPGKAFANEGDDAWKLRAEFMDGDLASAVHIERAILAYRRSYQDDPFLLEARWKLLRALHFLVDFSNAADERKDVGAQEAIELAEASIQSLTPQGDDSTDRAQLYFWSAIAWGVRAQRVGLLTAAREGAATRMQEYAEVSRSIDATAEQGGALRLLSRLHASLPRIPILTGWVDRRKALEFAEASIAVDSEHLGNKLVLALAIFGRVPERRAEAEEIIQELVKIEPSHEFRAEEIAIRKQARDQRLAFQEQVD
jgi:hypothetical protein